MHGGEEGYIDKCRLGIKGYRLQTTEKKFWNVNQVVRRKTNSKVGFDGLNGSLNTDVLMVLPIVEDIGFILRGQ